MSANPQSAIRNPRSPRRPITDTERATPGSLYYVEPPRTWPRTQLPEPVKSPRKPGASIPFRRARYLPETFYGDRAL